MVAARVIRKKSVFCIDNLNTSCTVGDITEFVTNEYCRLKCSTASKQNRDDDEVTMTNPSREGKHFVYASVKTTAVVY